MDGIVHRTIHQVAKHKTREKNKGIRPHEYEHQGENDGGNDQAGYGRHEKPFFIAGEVVVIAMHYIDHSLGFLTVCYHMKDPAVHQVFEKGPEEHTTKEKQRNPYRTELEPRNGIIAKSNDHRQVDAPDHERMGLCQKFKGRVLKQLRLPLIVNFLKFHASRISANLQNGNV
jgi:hypothetical protein